MTHEPANAPRLAGSPRIIGKRQVSHVAIGGASWSLGRHQDAGNAIATIHAAIDSCITTIDTARAYTTLDHQSHNEWIIARALSAHRNGDSVFVATKSGHFRRGSPSVNLAESVETMASYAPRGRSVSSASAT
jgi:aryl-alcohol dehydrogenase-like predicted oxidoreductase